MGTKITLSAFLTSLFILVNCSPKIAEMEGQGITRSQFSQLLEASQPKYFAQNHEAISKRLYNWRRLKTALQSYLDGYSVWKELQGKSIADSVSQKNKDLVNLVSLGEYTFILLKKKESERKSPAKPSFIFKDKVLKAYLLDDRPAKDRPHEDEVILSVEGYISLSLKEIISFFPGRQKKELYNFVSKTLVPVIHTALKGKSLGFHRHPQYLKWQRIKWRKYLIHIYQDKMREQFKTVILAHQESELKDYYEKNKSQQAYKEIKDKKNKTLQKYHYSYSRVKSDLVDTFVDKEMNKWKKNLWKKYKIHLEESYFRGLEHQEMEKLLKDHH